MSPPVGRLVNYPDGIDPSTGPNGNGADTHTSGRPIHESVTSRPANDPSLVGGEGRFG
jgi:hypothetical protein